MAEEKFISEFNEAAFQISRLHNKWLQFFYLLEHGSLVPSKWKLDIIAVELWNDAKRLDGEEDEKESEKKKEERYNYKLKEFDKKIAEAEKTDDKEKLYFYLIEKARLLKEIQDAAGKGTRYKPADDDYM